MAISPHVIAITNRKGGTGKTTVSVNAAAELAARGLRVLLVDLDSQGHCAVGLGIQVGRGGATVHDIFRHVDARLSAAIQPTAFDKLFLAPADPLFEHGSGLREENLLVRALADEKIASAFDVVILDTPPSMDILLINALTAATLVVVPYVPHPLSLEGVRQLMRVLFKMMSGPNQQLKIAGFLPMMVANHIRVQRAINGEVVHQFGSSRVLPGIRNDTRLVEAFALGKPIRYSAPKSRAAEDFAHLGAFLARLCP